MWFDHHGLIKKLFSDYKNNLSATFSYFIILSPQKSLQQDFLPQVKISKEYLPEYITEYFLHEHYDLVEKGCYNRSTKIDLLGNWHLFWSQILLGCLCYPEFALWETQVYFLKSTFKCAMISYLSFSYKGPLDPGFHPHHHKYWGMILLLQNYLRYWKIHHCRYKMVL